MDNLFSHIEIFFTENPHYFYLIAGVVFGILSMGHFMNKNWAIDPANSSQRFNYEIFGHNAYRIFMGIVFLIGAIACLFGFFYN